MRSMTTGERDPGRYKLGHRVKEARGRLSLRAVAKDAGIAVETLWQMEEGRRRDGKTWSPPLPETILAVARVLRIPQEEALDLAGYDAGRYLAPADDDGPPTSAPPVLAAKMHHLDDEDLRALEHLVDKLLRAKGYIAPDAPRPDGHDDPRHPTVVSHPPQPAREGSIDLGGQFGVGDPPLHESVSDRNR